MTDTTTVAATRTSASRHPSRSVRSATTMYTGQCHRYSEYDSRPHHCRPRPATTRESNPGMSASRRATRPEITIADNIACAVRPPRNSHDAVAPSTRHHISAIAPTASHSTHEPARARIRRDIARADIGIAATAPHRIEAARVSVPMYTRVTPELPARTTASSVDSTTPDVIRIHPVRSGRGLRCHSSAMATGHTT